MTFQEILRASWRQKIINSFSYEHCIDMILQDIKIFSQNICKNNFVINTILKTHNLYNIIFIQELSWPSICFILSSMNKKGGKLVGIPNYPNWIIFFRNPICVGDSPRVITYINIKMSSLQFSLWKDIFNHRDISCILFSNCGLLYFLINIYSNSSQSALKCLKNTEVNINNILIMTENFNIRNSMWDLNFPHHLLHRDILFKVTDFFQLKLSKPTEHFLTKHLDN